MQTIPIPRARALAYAIDTCAFSSTRAPTASRAPLAPDAAPAAKYVDGLPCNANMMAGSSGPVSKGRCDLPDGESYLYQTDGEDKATCKALCANAQACKIVTYKENGGECVLLESCGSWHSDDDFSTWEKVVPPYISGNFTLSTRSIGGTSWATSALSVASERVLAGTSSARMSSPASVDGGAARGWRPACRLRSQGPNPHNPTRLDS